MALISPSIPAPGDPAGVGSSEATVSAALAVIVNAINGGLDDVNLSAALRPFVKPDWGGTLPSTPADGQIYDYVAGASNGIIWRLRYRAAATTMPWECIGWSNYLRSGVFNGPTAYGNTDLPGVKVPLAGDYTVQAEVRPNVNDTDAAIAIRSGNSTLCYQDKYTSGSSIVTLPYPIHIAAPGTIPFNVNRSTAGSLGFAWMIASPIRVSA